MRFVAGRGAAAKSHQEDVAGQGAMAELLAESAMAELLAGNRRKALRQKKESDP